MGEYEKVNRHRNCSMEVCYSSKYLKILYKSLYGISMLIHDPWYWIRNSKPLYRQMNNKISGMRCMGLSVRQTDFSLVFASMITRRVVEFILLMSIWIFDEIVEFKSIDFDTFDHFPFRFHIELCTVRIVCCENREVHDSALDTRHTAIWTSLL